MFFISYLKNLLIKVIFIFHRISLKFYKWYRENLFNSFHILLTKILIKMNLYKKILIFHINNFILLQYLHTNIIDK